MIHSDTWWEDCEADTVLQPWLQGASPYARQTLLASLKEPSNESIILSKPHHQGLIKKWAQLGQREWEQAQTHQQTLSHLEERLEKQLLKEEPDWNSHIFFTTPILRHFNQYEWIHHIWTFLSLYTQPISTILVPLITLLIPILLLSWKRIPIPWNWVYGKFTGFFQYALGTDILPFRHQYHWTTLGILLVKRWISVGVYFYGIWSSLKQSLQYQSYAQQIIQQFQMLRRWFQTSLSLLKQLPDASQTIIHLLKENLRNIEEQFSVCRYEKDYRHFWFPSRCLIPGRCWTQWHRWMNWRDSFQKVKESMGKMMACFHLASLLRNSTPENPICQPTWKDPKVCPKQWKKGWHPGLFGTQPHLQSYTWKQSRRFWLILGANATGKTTFLKMATWIHWMGQAWGIAPCKTANLHWMNHFWSWVRVPDRTGQESLFEAEVRRARNILSSLRTIQHKDESAWIWMDEVFGSTNVEESTRCAYATLRLCVSQYPGLYGGCTTHLLGLSQLKKTKGIHMISFQMKKIKSKTITNTKNESKWMPTYRFKSGVLPQALALDWVEQKGEMPEDWMEEARSVRFNKSIFLTS